jgi:hypothetical protein
VAPLALAELWVTLVALTERAARLRDELLKPRSRNEIDKAVGQFFTTIGVLVP